MKELMDRPFPRKCATCRERAVQFVVLPSYSTSAEHDGRSYSITLSDVPGSRCANCKSLVLADSVADQIDNQLRVVAGLLQPHEIKSRRQALKLTQKALAEALRVGEATLCRWETGAQIQQRSMDLSLRLFFDIPEVRRYLGVAPMRSTETTIPNLQNPIIAHKPPEHQIRWEPTSTSIVPSSAAVSGVAWMTNVRKQSLDIPTLYMGVSFVWKTEAQKQPTGAPLPEKPDRTDLKVAG